MQRSWLVLLVLVVVSLAGCSALGGNPGTSDGAGDVSYPSGWGPNGPDNATRAIAGAQDMVAGSDFVERWVTVEETKQGMEDPYLVVVTEVRIDRDRERLLNQRRFYRVDAELAAAVAESGVEPLADRTANEVRQTYVNDSGGAQYHRLEARSPRITRLQSGDFASATDQPLPATLVASAPVFETATYSNATRTDAGVRYSISGVSAFHVDDGAGSATVGDDGLVSGFAFSATDPDSEEAFRYDLEVGDLTLDRPDWVGQDGSNTSQSG